MARFDHQPWYQPGRRRTHMRRRTTSAPGRSRVTHVRSRHADDVFMRQSLHRHFKCRPLPESSFTFGREAHLALASLLESKLRSRYLPRPLWLGQCCTGNLAGDGSRIGRTRLPARYDAPAYPGSPRRAASRSPFQTGGNVVGSEVVVAVLTACALRRFVPDPAMVRHEL